MSTWISTRREFGDRVALVRIDRMLLIDVFRQSDVLGDGPGPNPDAIAGFVERIIAIARPDLAGGWAASVSFSGPAYCWEVVYCHHSLHRVAFGMMLPELLLTVTQEQAARFLRETGRLAAVGGRVEEPEDQPFVSHAAGTGERRAEFGGRDDA